MKLFSVQSVDQGHDFYLGRGSRLLIIAIISALIMLPGCSAWKRLQKTVGMKQRQVFMKDLGPSYAPYIKTEFDYFSKKSSVKKLTKTKPIAIKYKTFSLKKYDRFTKKSNVIYAKFRYAEKLNLSFDKMLGELIKNEFKGETRKTIREAIKKRSADKLNTVTRIKNSYQSLKLSLITLKELISDANDLIKESDGIIQQSKNALMKDPQKAILADQLLVESKETLSKLQEVITGTPHLIGALKKSVRIADVAKLAKDL